MRPPRRQKPIRGGRDAVSGSVIKELRRRVEREAVRYNISKSFVVAVALALYFKIDLGEHY